MHWCHMKKVRPTDDLIACRGADMARPIGNAVRSFRVSAVAIVGKTASIMVPVVHPLGLRSWIAIKLRNHNRNHLRPTLSSDRDDHIHGGFVFR